MFGRATITLGIGPHSSYYYFELPTIKYELNKRNFIVRLLFRYVLLSVLFACI